MGAQASVQKDRERILNAIAKKPSIDGEPAKTHSEYTIVNKLLAGHFGGAVWNEITCLTCNGIRVQMAELDWDDQKDQKVQKEIADASADSGIKKFTLAPRPNTFCSPMKDEHGSYGAHMVCSQKDREDRLRRYLTVIPRAVRTLDLVLSVPDELPKNAGIII